jgi:hypothetical protein
MGQVDGQGDYQSDARAEKKLLLAEVQSWVPGPRKIRKWVDDRAHAGPLDLSHAANQRRQSLRLLVFGLVRVAIWTVLGLCVLAGIFHVAGFDWARVLAESIPFVALISIYANWATDLDAATAAFAALVAADAHATSERNRRLLVTERARIEDDIARLADLDPGPEAQALADAIRTRLDRESYVNGNGTA